MKRYSYLFEYRQTTLRGYELDLGKLEVQAIAGNVKRKGEALHVEVAEPIPETALRRVTFFEKVTIVHPDGRHDVVTPDQVILEKSARAARAATPTTMVHLLEHIEEIPNAGREHTYLSHAWHQYKGKFYPQLVRSAFVIAGLSEGATVLDPFVGSGTTLVETYLNNFQGFGVDLNPLAAYLSEAKTDCLALSSEVVTSQIEDLVERLIARLLDNGIEDELVFASEGGSRAPRADVDRSGIPNLDYLARWFDDEALDKLAILIGEIRAVRESGVKNLLWVTLSDLLRDFSLQDPQQFRIQRRKDRPRTERLLYRFVIDARKNARAVVAMNVLRDRLQVAGVKQFTSNADARDLRSAPFRALREDGQIDLIVTSPPYATALPYIDTDRLSLFLLGLLEPSERSSLDLRMIGNREIRDRERRILENEFEAALGAKFLPQSVLRLVRRVRDLNNGSEVGFRRKNLAALLFKYFSDMNECFAEMTRVLRPGGFCVVVIGNSYTLAGGQPVDIATDRLLVDLATAQGLVLWKKLAMTDQAAYLPHSQNTIRSESIIFLRKPARAG